MIEVKRQTKETDITLRLSESSLSSLNQINTKRMFLDDKLGFFEHMLKALTYYADLELSLSCASDVWVDTHHTLEDIGIVFGQAVKQLMSSKTGFERFGLAFVPMDDALVRTVIDISGRPYFTLEGFDLTYLPESEQALIEFLRAFSHYAGLTVHIDIIRGKNRHHIYEAVFKSFGQALKCGMKVKEDVISTKGCLA